MIKEERMALSYIIIICLVLAEAHMWILGNLDADQLQLWSSHLLFVSFGKYCIMRDTKTAVPLNGRRDGLFSETDNPPPQFNPPSFLQLDPLLIILTNIHASWRMQSRGPSGWGLQRISMPPPSLMAMAFWRQIGSRMQLHHHDFYSLSLDSDNIVASPSKFGAS